MVKMAMAKLVCVLLLALLSISMVATKVMAKEAQYHLDSSAHLSAREGVARHSTANHACFSAKNAAQSACAFPLATMVTRLCALAITTGRPRKEDPNAPNYIAFSTSNL
ncbi:hypothetical protein L1049_027357 [Liquidambar formosana]|uniref:Uncharacterized protein n=1 Tax=Liquidambar formosana TaxID=63359 RepID=A0AAP0RKJ4_LIQFO